MASEPHTEPERTLSPEEKAKERDSYVLTGITVGGLMGLVLGLTFWTHDPDIALVVITTIFVLTCAAAGGAIGKLASGMDFD